jgi:peptidoglycan lytic transglycosylase
LPFLYVRVCSLAVLLLFVVACGGDDDSPDPADQSPASEGGAPPGATEAPGSVLTPRAGVPADMPLARALESEGELEKAADAYIIVAASPGPDKLAATHSAARLLLELEKPQSVRLLLEPMLLGQTVPPEQTAGRYFLARAYAALDMWNESLAQYDLYVQSGRAALPYAYLDRAQTLIALGRAQEAMDSLQSGLAMGVPDSMRRTYLLALGQSNEAADDAAGAIGWYTALINESARDAPVALARIASIKRRGADTSYGDDLNRLFSSYPGSPQALEELNAALARGEPVDAFVRGVVYYRHGDYTTAEPAFRERIGSSLNEAGVAESHYYLAAILESRGDVPPALDSYSRVTELNPQSHLADDALWWRARILEEEEKFSEAWPLYQRVVHEYPGSVFASDAAFRDGMLEYRMENFHAAAGRWEQRGAVVADADERARLDLWRGKALVRANDRAGSESILTPLRATNDVDYTGMRARAVVRDQHNLANSEKEASVNLAPGFDWVAAEAWLVQKTGRPLSEAWTGDPRWLRAQELWLVGRTRYAEAEMLSLVESYARDPMELYTLSRRLAGDGRVSTSARTGQRLLAALQTEVNVGVPKPILSLAYPAAFGAMVKRYAEEEKISPLLMLAFIRQESLFDPRAVSPAGAMGLTQVLPATGEQLAPLLNVQQFDSEDLLQADLNLRFGARFMADQLRRFGGEISVALAAYNGGPNAAKRWRDSSGPDADLFLEAIEFSESRAYVEIVSENYAIYRYLYGGQPEPNLP